MTLDEARQHVGAGVVYQPPYVHGLARRGIIYAVAGQYVLVLYDGEHTPKATAPSVLTLAGRP